jgi:predicted nuclease with TOPRIM domain
MLNQLQANVESEETRWRSRLSDKESQLDKIQRDLEAIKVKNAAMEDSLNSLNSAEEVRPKF